MTKNEFIAPNTRVSDINWQTPYQGPPLVLYLLSAKLAIEEILEGYQHLSREDGLACVAYGAEMSRERFVDVPLERPA